MNRENHFPGLARIILEGDRALLEGPRPRRAVLISRTPGKPTPATPWVRATVEAVRRSVEAGEVIVTGLGRTAYDVVLAACRKANGAAIVVLPGNIREAVWREYAEGLLPERRLIVASHDPPATGKETRRVAARLRDEYVGMLADRAWGVWIREGGNMAAVAKKLRARGCPVDGCGLRNVDSGLKKKPPAPLPVRHPAFATCPWDYLTHYTRAPRGAWPDETPAAHAAWLAHGPRDATREAFDALQRILTMRKILGSARLMPGRGKMVSLTARPPWELAGLMRWRRGLRRWTFQPYGIALPREALAARGARPVQYLSTAMLKVLPPPERAFAQKHEPPRTAWSGEAEWRVPGALRLDALPGETLCVLVPSAAEARRIEREFGMSARAICE